MKQTLQNRFPRRWLLLATTPERAVLSVGYNTYGHPADETLERLAAAGCEIYRTDWMGTVRITAE